MWRAHSVGEKMPRQIGGSSEKVVREVEVRVVAEMGEVKEVAEMEVEEMGVVTEVVREAVESGRKSSV